MEPSTQDADPAEGVHQDENQRAQLRQSQPTNNGSNNNGSHHDTSPFHDYASLLYSFAMRSPEKALYSGTHYQELARFLVPSPIQIPSLNNPPANGENNPNFVTMHILGNRDRGGRGPQSTHWNSFNDLNSRWDSVQGNRLLFLQGYSSAQWLCQLGGKFNLSYEFLHQHYSHPSRLGVDKNYCLPAPFLVGSGAFQLTFTSIGFWDNYQSGIDLSSARTTFDVEMKEFVTGLNSGKGPVVGDSVVREFHLHDLKHFSIEQMISVQLIQHKGCWTVLLWTDFGKSLSHSHRGPWRTIEQKHASSIQFLSVPMNFNNVSIRRLAASSNRGRGIEGSDEQSSNIMLLQTPTYLSTEIGQLTDQKTASQSPFYALDEVFRLFAASEHQFLNLMAEKAGEQGKSVNLIRVAIAELRTIKKLVVQHLHRLHDVASIVEARGGRIWARASTGPEADTCQKAEEAAEDLAAAFKKLLQRAKNVSKTCDDEIAMLSNDSVVLEAQKSIQQADRVAKVTFIAFIFVPLSFTTSFFGMNIKELNDNGQGIAVWVALTLPIVLISLCAWWLDADTGRQAWAIVRRYFTIRKPFGRKSQAGESELEPFTPSMSG